MNHVFYSKNDEKVVIRQLESIDAKNVLQYLCIVGGETDYLLFDHQGLGISIAEEEHILDQYYNHPNSLLLGCFIGEKIVSISNLSVKEKQRIKHISSLGISVKKQYWHQGIGRNLMKYMIEYAQKNDQIKVIQLEVRSDNLNAISLYKEMGFHSIGTMPKAMKIDDIYYENQIMLLEV